MGRRYRSLLWQWARRAWRRPQPVAIETWPRVAPGEVSVTRVGHATLVIRYSALAIITDPFLRRFCNGVGRAEAVGLSAKSLPELDLVLISSPSADHLHRPSLEVLPRSATVVVPQGCARELAGLGFRRVLELAPGLDFSHRGVEVTTAQGAPSSLLYVLRGDGPSVLYCGESGPCQSFAKIGETIAPDLALLPIGGYSPSSFRRRHLTPAAALDAFEELRARVFIPHRYGALPLSYEHLDDPLAWLDREVRERGLERYVEILRAGETQLLVPPRGRAQTEFGQPRRTMRRGRPESDEDLPITLGAADADSSYDEIHVDTDIAWPPDESLRGL